MAQWETKPAGEGAGDGSAWSPPTRRRGWRRWRPLILWGGGALLLLILIAVILAPTIATRIAPGYVQSAVNEQIPGRIEIRSVRLGWGGPTVAGPVALFDDQGQPVADVQVTVPVGLWTVLSERWWGRRQFDLGTIVIRGNADIVRGPDGRTNLERALGIGEPTPAPSPPPRRPGPPAQREMPPGGLERVTATVRFEDLDATFIDQTAPPGTVTAQGISLRDLSGDVALDYRGSRQRLDATVKADLAGVIRSGPGTGQAAADRQRIVVDATTRIGRNYQLENVDASARITALSTPLLDLIGGFRGELAATMGPRADVAVAAVGSAERARATVDITSEGAGVNLRLDYNGARVSLEQPGRIWARSTRFLAGLDAAQDPIARAREAVRLDSAPAFEVLLETLHIPLTAQQLTGEGPITERLDLRGAQLGLRLRTEGFGGQVALEQGARPADAQPNAAPAWRPFSVEPLEVAVATQDLARGVRLTASTRAAVDGQSAGVVQADLLAGGVLDAQGRPVTGVPRQLDGQVRITEVSTRLVQPLIAGLGLPLDLPQDAGPRIDIALTAATSPGQTAADPDDLPPTDITAAIGSQNVNATADLRIEEGVATTRGEGVQVRIAAAAPLAQRILAAGDGGAPGALAVGGTGGVQISVRNLRAPLEGAGGDLRGVAADVDMTLSDLLIGLEGEQIQAQRTRVSLLLPADGSPRAALEAALSHAGNPFQAAGELSLPQFRAAWPMRPEDGPVAGLLAMAPQGRIEVRGLPGTLTRLAPALHEPPTGPDDVAAQVRGLIRGLIGERADLRAEIAPADGAAPQRSARVTVNAFSAGAASESAFVLSPDRIAVERAGVVATLRPQEVDPVLAAATPRAEGDQPPRQPMRLRAPATLRASVDPIAIPLRAPANGGAPAPDFTGVSEVIARVGVDEPMLIENVPLGEQPQAVGFQGLAVTAAVPGGLLAGTDPSTLQGRVTVSTTLVRAADPQRGGTEALAGVLTNAAFPMTLTSYEANVDLQNIRTAGVDALLQQGGALVGALGDTARIRVNASGRTAEGTLTAETTIESPRLRGAPARIAMDRDAIRLTNGGRFEWTPDLAWLNQMVMSPGAQANAAPAQPQQQPAPARGGDVIGRPAGNAGAAPGPARAAQPAVAARITEIAPIVLSVDRLVLSRPREADPQARTSARGPLLPGVFNLGMVVQTPRIVLDPGDGRPPVAFQGVRASAWSPPEAGSVGFDLLVESVTGAGAAGEQRSLISGRAARIADAAGVLTPDRLEIFLNGNLAAFPTPIIDAFARQSGLLTEALGPTISLRVQADRVGPEVQRGLIRAEARSERATAQLGGEIRDGVFVQTEPTQLSLLVVTPSLVQQLGGSLPVVGTLEKRREDEPGIVRADNLSLPLDGDLRNFSGRITVDLGVARFTTAGGLTNLLRFTGGRQEGMIGRRIEPFVVNIDRGVMSYDRFRLALGEFTIETTGRVDLVDRRMDVVTYVPFFALTEEAAGLLSTGLGQALGRLPGGIDRATLVPLRTSGSLDSPRTQVDTDLFVREFGRGLLDTPGRLVDDVLRRRLEDLLRPPGQGNGGAAPPPNRSPR